MMSEKYSFNKSIFSSLAYPICVLFLLLFVTLQSFAQIPKKPLSKSKHLPTIRVAVAANFISTLSTLASRFTQETGVNVQLISGASGNLYQQIVHGAPFDVFLSADKERPKRLVSSNLSSKNSLTTYAIGTLSFWSPRWETQPTHQSALDVFHFLKSEKVRLAIANPTIAPYGFAAKMALEKSQVWEVLDKKNLITGININQTFQQTRSGAVSLGMVATSQLIQNKLSGIKVPETYYHPIEQQLVILKSSVQRKEAHLFVNFLLSPKSQTFIQDNGYQSATLKQIQLSEKG